MMSRYRSINSYLREQFGEKVYKLSLDGGFTCPTRDGAKGTRGCIFCSGGSGDFSIPVENDVLEEYKITLFDNGTAMFRYVLKKIDTSRVKDSIAPFFFQLETDTGNILMTMKKDISDDIMGFDVNVADANYKLTGRRGVSKNLFGAVLNKADSEEMLFCMKKNVSYFSDRIEFDIQRIENPIEDVVYISIVTACDSIIRKVSGGGYRN